MLGTIAVIEEGGLRRTFYLEDFPPAPARLASAEEGIWVLWSDHAQLFSPEGGVLRSIEGEVLDVLGDRMAVPEGVLLAGELQLTGAPPLRLFPGGIALLDDGRVIDDAGEILCQAPFGSRLAAWDGEEIFVVKGGSVGSCGRQEEIGNEPKVPVLVGEELWVLDRIGDQDPNTSVVRVLDKQTLVELRQFPTGKNSGYGGWDGERLWVNSEGSTEILGLLGEEVDRRVTTGAHVESVAGGVVSGRLSNRLWADGVEAEVRWPVAPLLHGGRLYVVAQLDMQIVVLDPETLGVLETWDLGLEPNDTLTLSDLVWCDGSLWLTDGARDELLRVTGGQVEQRIALGTPLPRNASGRLELVVGDGALYVVRARDGRVHRVDAEGASEPVWVEIGEGSRMQLGGWDGGVLWVGPVGLDGDTLEPIDDADWDFFVGRWRGRAVSWRDGELLLGQEVVATQAGEEPPEVTLSGRKVVLTDIEEATVRTLEL